MTNTTLRELREEKGLNKSEMAKKFKISRCRIAKLENGQIKLTAYMAVKLANFFEVDVSSFYDGYINPILFHRVNTGITNADLAKMLGVCKTHLSLIQTNGRHITRGMANKLSDIFNVDADTFYTIVKDPEYKRQPNEFDVRVLGNIRKKGSIVIPLQLAKDEAKRRNKNIYLFLDRYTHIHKINNWDIKDNTVQLIK